MMQVFPLFQKWNFIHKTRYWDQCFIIPFLWHFWNKKFLFLKYYFLYHHQWENLHKIYERILFLIFTLYYYEFKIPQNLSLIIKPKYFLNPNECHSLCVEIRASIWVFSGPKDSIWGANESKHHACLREQTESTWIRTIY